MQRENPKHKSGFTIKTKQRKRLTIDLWNNASRTLLGCCFCNIPLCIPISYSRNPYCTSGRTYLHTHSWLQKCSSTNVTQDSCRGIRYIIIICVSMFLCSSHLKINLLSCQRVLWTLQMAYGRRQQQRPKGYFFTLIYIRLAVGSDAACCLWFCNV